MDEKTLPTILGHHSVSFTLDTYAYVLKDHLNQEMGLMEELYHMNQIPPQNLICPIVMAPACNGYVLQSPDFPGIQIVASTMEDGVVEKTTSLRDAALALAFPLAPSSPTNIPLLPGQFLLQVTL